MRYLRVVVEIPDDVPVAEAKDYVKKWLRWGGGERQSNDPLRRGLEVVSLRNIRKPENIKP
jgi:hypothetical protein